MSTIEEWISSHREELIRTARFLYENPENLQKVWEYHRGTL